ncbi:MAG: response regulator [Acidobacteriaceae bacterium]|nr:response regulator [Acidobacteriaceae bacterium]
MADSMFADNRARIVIVEDNSPDVLLVSESLSAQSIDHELIHFRDASEAMDKLADLGTTADTPDVIIVDLNMPRMSGLEFLGKLKEQRTLSGVPIAVLTSSLSPEERDEAERLGADRFLRKPIDLYEYLDEVGTMISDLIRLRRSQQI